MGLNGTRRRSGIAPSTSECVVVHRSARAMISNAHESYEKISGTVSIYELAPATHLPCFTGFRTISRPDLVSFI